MRRLEADAAWGRRKEGYGECETGSASGPERHEENTPTHSPAAPCIPPTSPSLSTPETSQFL